MRSWSYHTTAIYYVILYPTVWLITKYRTKVVEEDVVSSVVCSDQVIVIGDRKQLPPTSFFSTGDSEEDSDDENGASYESILDEC